MKTYKLHLVRHGLTQANMDGLYIGSTNVPLAPKGIEDLKNLKNKFEYPTAGILFSSPLTRCLQTAEILFSEMKRNVIDDLRECDFGNWENKSADSLKSDPDFLKWISSGEVSATCTAESMESFTHRIRSCFETLIDNIIRNEKKDAIVVTHGGVIMTALALFGVPKAKPFEWHANNGCGYSVRITPSMWMRDKVFEVYDKIPDSIYCKSKNDMAFVTDSVQLAKNELLNSTKKASHFLKNGEIHKQGDLNEKS